MKNLLFWGFLLSVVAVRIVSDRPDLPEGKTVKITGTVSQEPVVYSYYQKINLNGVKIFLEKYPEVSYGDKISVIGEITNGELNKPKLNFLDRKVLPFSTVRQKIISFFQQSFPEPHASLIAGTVLGSRGVSTGSFWEEIKKVGVAHVVVASGMNVTLVSGFLLSLLLLFVSRRKAVILAAVSIWGYVLLSGFDAPLVRAAIMGSTVFLGQFLGRVVSTLRILLITSLIMLIIFPQWIIDLGFILSFVATFSLILFQPKVQRYFSFLPGFLKEGLVTSTAAQIGVAPIIFVTFGRFSLLSPLVNALVLWTVGPMMVIGMLSGLLGLVWPALGKILLYLSYPLTAWFTGIVRLFSQI